MMHKKRMSKKMLIISIIAILLTIAITVAGIIYIVKYNQNRGNEDPTVVPPVSEPEQNEDPGASTGPTDVFEPFDPTT